MDEFAGERRLEQQVAGQRRAPGAAAGAINPHGSQHGTHRRRQRPEVPRGDVVDALTGCDHQNVDRAQLRLRPLLRGQQLQGAVDALHALDVHRQRVQEDAGHGMARDLSQVGVLTGHRSLGLRFVQAAGPHHEDAICPQVNGRGDGRSLAHGAITQVVRAPLHVELDRREDKRDGRRGHEVIEREPLAHGQALRTGPGLDRLGAVVVGDVLAAGVARPRDRHRIDVPLGHQVGQALHVEQVRQQLAQGFVVEQGARAGAAPAGHGPAQREQGQPLGPALDDAEGVGAIDLLGAEISPDLDHGAQGEVVVVGPTGQGHGVEGASRGAADDAKGAGAALLARITPNQLQGLEHTDLVGGACAPTGQDQCGLAWLAHARCPGRDRCA